MKKKLTALFAFALALMLVCALAAAEIAVDKKDLSQNRDLDKSVNNVLFLLQDGDVTSTIMLASINSKTGRSVMTSFDPDMMTPVEGAGDVALGSVYALAAEKSEGLLVAKTLNAALSLNITSYIVLDVTRLPELVSAVGDVNIWLTEDEAAGMGLVEGDNYLNGEQALAYVRMKLDVDTPDVNRGYETLMQLLRQAMGGGNVMNLVSLGTKLLSSMDTNLGAMNAMTLFSAVQGGSDRREIVLPLDEQITAQNPLTADFEAMRQTLYAEIYE